MGLIDRHLDDDACLDTSSVLVDADDVLVEQKTLRGAFDGAQVIGHDERSRPHRPHRHVNSLLVIAQAEVANHQLRTCTRLTR